MNFNTNTFPIALPKTQAHCLLEGVFMDSEKPVLQYSLNHR